MIIKKKYFWWFLAFVLALAILLFLLIDNKKEIDRLDYWRGDLLPEWNSELTKEQKTSLQGKIDEISLIINNSDEQNREDLFFAYLKLGIYMESLNRPAESRDAYLQASLYNQESAIPWLNLHTFYRQASDLVRAEEALNKALELEPSSELVWGKVLDFYQYDFSAELITMLDVFDYHHSNVD